MPDDTRTAEVPVPAEAGLAAALSGAGAQGSAYAPPNAEPAAADQALAAEFRVFRRSWMLGGLDPRALIREGLR